jgi:enoyl-CoA hydratase/carnithine racemase
VTITLNRPAVLNTLTLEMVRLIRRSLEEAAKNEAVRLVVLRGAGDRAFCAGGDLKAAAQAVRSGAYGQMDNFFREEYALDFFIHHYPKPVMALAHAITMGGGLGLAAGADLTVVTERTRMAMPETRIGFFPDVGATGWLFRKCPRGYPEFLALTGYEMVGAECVRLGLAHCLIRWERRGELEGSLERLAANLSPVKAEAARQLRGLEPLSDAAITPNPDIDAWVAENFAGKASVGEIMASLSQCSPEDKLCQETYKHLSEVSPTALALTLKLLRRHEGRDLREVFEAEARAARFMIRHPDYLEGIRARIIDKDNRPRWRLFREEERFPGLEFLDSEQYLASSDH